MAITLSGFNNIDFKAIVDIIIKSERQPIDRLQADQKVQETRLAAYGSLSTGLSSLQSAFEALKTPSAYGSLSAASSDETILKPSATSSTSKGTFSINVVSLARPQVTASAARQFNDINASIINGGSFSVTQNGTTKNIDLTGVTTLAQLRDAINSQQSGIKASIVNDGSTTDIPARPFRLVLTSATPGVSNSFTVSDQTTGTALSLDTDATNGVARDTELRYNGITIKSTSTNVSDAIPGLTLNLFKIGDATVTITDDASSLKDRLAGAVDAFNAFNGFVQDQFKLGTSSAQPPPLSTDPLLRGLNRQIRSYFISNHANSGDIANIGSLGIKLTRAGKLEIDDAALGEALANNPNGVKNFLSGTGGFAAKVSDYIQSYTQANGSIDSVEARIKTTVASYSNKIFSMESQLVLREDSLTKQFAAADRAISQLNSQGSALTNLGNQYRLF